MPAHRLDLERRVERITVNRRNYEVELAIEVKYAESARVYCSQACWTEAEPSLAEAFPARTTYPPFNFISSCCRCGELVNRTNDHVCYPICEMVHVASHPSVAHCLEERDWLVLCLACEFSAELISAASLTFRSAFELERI